MNVQHLQSIATPIKRQRFAERNNHHNRQASRQQAMLRSLFAIPYSVFAIRFETCVGNEMNREYGIRNTE